MSGLLALPALLFLAAPAAAQPVDEAAVRQTVQDLLDSWREADAAKGDAVLHPDFRLATRHDNFAADDTGPHGPLPAVSIAGRAAMIALYANLTPGAWDDRLSDVAIHVDPSGIATLWARYRFRIDGRLTHCGAVALTLYRTDRRWRIVDFADTHHWAEPGEADGCAPPAAPSTSADALPR
jgi:ketosteroid isomerase-like protein